MKNYEIMRVRPQGLCVKAVTEPNPRKLPIGPGPNLRKRTENYDFPITSQGHNFQKLLFSTFQKYYIQGDGEKISVLW